MQLATAGVVFAIDSYFGIIVGELQGIVYQVANNLLDSQFILNQFLGDVVWNVAIDVDTF